eukprot:m.615879 g.615879  ORF g.615879 m.615879 type:complete len:313 (+) comp22510_c0_seq4:1953-2891(+)
MAYTFRVCITNRSLIRVPFVSPEGYNRSDFELLSRFINASAITKVDQLIWRFALPDGKFDVCNYGPLSTMPVGLQWAWPGGSAATRQVIWQQHKDYVSGFLYFLANDPAVPESIRSDLSTFGLCGDEFEKTNHWPPQLYVRESRRVLGDRIFTYHDRLKPLGWGGDTTVGLGAFWFDSVVVDRSVYTSSGSTAHGRVQDTSSISERVRVYNEGNYNAYSPHTPFDLPYWLLLPRSEDVAMFLPNNPSSSHVGFSSLRLEPTMMILGQAAVSYCCCSMCEQLASEGVAGGCPNHIRTFAVSVVGIVVLLDLIV